MNFKFTVLLIAILVSSTSFAGSFVCFSTSDPSNLGRTVFEIPFPDGKQGNLSISTAMGENLIDVKMDQYSMGNVFADRNESSIVGGYILFKTPIQFQNNKYLSITWIENKYLEDMPATITYMNNEGLMQINSYGACTSYQ